MTIARLHSITDVGDTHADLVACTGSHGGLYAAWVAHHSPLRAAIFNDAGMGFEGAGTAGVHRLAEAGMAAAAVTHTSARIGDAHETAGGTIGTVNALAERLGVRPGQNAAEAARLLATAQRGTGDFEGVSEGTGEWRTAKGLVVTLLDSASLVGPGHVGGIVVTGSHGGLVGGDASRAIKAPVRLAVFNDAGVGKDEAGVERIRVLGARGVAAAAVSHDTAPIGLAAPMLDGTLSLANAPAEAMGLSAGERLRDALEELDQIAPRDFSSACRSVSGV